MSVNIHKIILLSLLSLIFLFSAETELQAQKTKTAKENAQYSSITGIIKDSNGNPIPFATLKLFSKSDSKLVTGAIGKNDGSFEIQKVAIGNYYLTIDYVGFKKKTIKSIVISADNSNINLKDILLTESVTTTEAVVVEAKKDAVEYSIDKKIVNIDKNLAASSSSAVEILSNVPSVNVDVEGNVSLRGSSSFTVQIDGRPSILDPSDALSQIPASSIENIEIITNPSAQHDPDGTAGIINIIMKKQKLEGTSGLVTLNAGQNNRYGGSALFQYKNDAYSAFVGLDYNNREHPGTSIVRNETNFEDLDSYLYSEGTRNWIRGGHEIKAGFEFDLSDNDKFSLQGSYGVHDMESRNMLDYQEWTSANPIKNRYKSEQIWTRQSKYVSATLDYIRTFDDPKHKLTARFIWSNRDGDEESNDEMFSLDKVKTFGAKYTEDGPSSRLRTKIDYILPFSEDNKFEAGYQSRVGTSEDITSAYEYDIASNAYVFQEDYSHSIEYKRNIHSLYSVYSGKYNDLGYQAGLRGEYTDRLITLMSTKEDFSIDRWDLFPSLHFSYKIAPELQFITSYSARIDRPRGWYLEPFITKSDAFNLRKGNPALKPEYIDSYELGVLKYIGKNSISLEGFYRYTENKIERIKTLIDGETNIFMNSPENVGTDYSLGAEIMISLKLYDAWDSQLSGSAYQYEINTNINNRASTKESFNWNARFRNTFSIFKNTSLELSLDYTSATASSQGTTEGYFVSSGSVRQDFFDGKLSTSLQIRDIFSTSKDEYTSIGPSYSIYSYYDRDAPVITFTLKYNFNNYKSKQRPEDNGSGGEDF